MSELRNTVLSFAEANPSVAASPTTSSFTYENLLDTLCKAFNTTPFMAHSGMQMRIVNSQIQAYFDMQPFMIGNQSFGILHGGISATLLDSLSGVFAMSEMYRLYSTKAGKWGDFSLAEITQKATRLATVDMRIDYIAPGRGKFFTGTAEVVRFGNKSCTIRSEMRNDSDILIATSMAVFAY